MSHLASIGLPVSSQEDLNRLVDVAKDFAKRIPCRQGSYLVWSSDAGAELWLHEHKNGHIVGFTPFFRGKGTVRIASTHFVERAGDNPLEGALHAWADPKDSEPESGEYPFVFDVVNIGLLDRAALPVVSDVQISAFAHEMRTFDSEQSFDQSQTGEAKFAPESFIPAGLFSPEGKKTSPPDSTAIFTGRVLECSELENPLTHKPFLWALVQTLGGRYDVVAAPEIVEGSLAAGGIVSGSFWLCGLLSVPEPRLIQRIIRKWN